jgi:hypothetical protein
MEKYKPELNRKKVSIDEISKMESEKLEITIDMVNISLSSDYKLPGESLENELIYSTSNPGNVNLILKKRNLEMGYM